MADYIPGYNNDIHQALWRRPQVLGAPRLWSQCWAGFGMALGLFALFKLPFWCLIIPVGMWGIGQGALVLLTSFDSQWDDMAGAWLTRKYQLFYDAG